MVNIKQPIFVIGCGRSGTTLLYELLCGHFDLAWFSHISCRVPALPQLAFFSRLYQIDWLRQRNLAWVPKPSEGYPFWDRIRPVENSPSDPPLTEGDATREEIARAHRLIGQHMFYHGRSRFINKNTRNTRRVKYLKALFDDALFIHIVRDPRATSASLVNVSWWPDLSIWCMDGTTPVQWQAEGKDPAELAAILWNTEVQAGLEARQYEADGQYMEIRYEDLTNKPEAVLEEILAWTGLGGASEARFLAAGTQIQSTNDKYKRVFTNSQLEIIYRVSHHLAAELGYHLDD